MATGKPVDIAVNHNENAISMHRVNHPYTQHFTCDVYEVKPHQVTGGRRVAHLHASPDCTHHSQAAGGQPRSTASRSLSWVIAMWAGQAAPAMITMENVKQIRNWGPLVAKRCKATGRVVTLERITCPRTGKAINRVAEPGERVPVQNQFLIPDPKRKGKTWRAFLKHLRGLGYQVEHQLLRACDYGAATTRERLFLVARRDGLPICWPEPTHFEKPKRGQKRWPAAADHIDFSLPCPSIFDRPRPLADCHHAPHRQRHPPLCARLRAALHRADCQPGELMVASPVLVGVGGPAYSGKPTDGGKPLGAILTENHRAIACAYMAQMNGGYNTTPGHSLTRQPAPSSAKPASSNWSPPTWSPCAALHRPTSSSTAASHHRRRRASRTG
ncbi:DNA cytosine methyltransferase [Halopseudomonas pachastrellae]|nr:DNA cytosine methyltransferase [Halopseudomonas pachastrellae]